MCLITLLLYNTVNSLKLLDIMECNKTDIFAARGKKKRNAEPTYDIDIGHLKLLERTRGRSLGRRRS